MDPRFPMATPVSDVEFQAPARPNTGQIGKPIWLRANYFKVSIPNGDIHHYDIDIKPDKCPRRVNRFVLDINHTMLQDKLITLVCYFLGKLLTPWLTNFALLYFKTANQSLMVEKICTQHNRCL